MPGAARNLRGNTVDRMRRVEWLIETFGIPCLRNPKRKAWLFCAHCGKRMRARPRRDAAGAWRRTWEIDRFPLCGHEGGRYVRGNMVVSCKGCNGRRCARKKCRGSALTAGPKWAAVHRRAAREGLISATGSA